MWICYASTFVTFYLFVTFRRASEEYANDPQSQTKWMPFDIIELRENYAAVDKKTPANKPSNCSEKEDAEFLSEKNA